MTANVADGILIGVPAIAEIADVKVNAVSNWRARHKDFPAPVMKTAHTMLFDAGDVERWLIEHSKIDRRVDAYRLVWPFLEGVRAGNPLDPEMLGDLVGALLVTLEVYQRLTGETRRAPQTELPDDPIVERLRDSALPPLAELTADRVLDYLHSLTADDSLCAAWRDHTMSAGLRWLPQLGADSARQLVTLLLSASTDKHVGWRDIIYMQLLDRIHAYGGKHGAAHTTPETVNQLFTRLAEGATSIFDPACGEGGTLWHTSRTRRRANQLPAIFGWDINPRACARAATLMLLTDTPADIRVHNSLHDTPLPGGPTGIDVVVCDPPFGLANWGDADLYTSERWLAGSPPPSSADLAWVQVALEGLNDTGRAYVILPAGSLTRGSREAVIRETLVRNRQISAIVKLPPKVYQASAIPVVLWCLRKTPTASSAADILLVDASRLGTPGRAAVTFTSTEIDDLGELVRRWETEHRVVAGRLQVDAVAVDERRILEADGDLNPARYYIAPEADAASLTRQRDAYSNRLAELAREMEDTLGDLQAQLRIAAEEPESAPTVVELQDVAAVWRGTVNATPDGEEQLFFGLSEVTAGKAARKAVGARKGLYGPTVEPGDVIVALAGSNVGAATVAGERDAGALVGRDCALVRVAKDEPRVTQAWLATVLRSGAVRHRLARLATGTTIPRASIEDLATQPIPEFTTGMTGMLLRHETLDRALAVHKELGFALQQYRTADANLAVAPAGAIPAPTGSDL